MDEIRKGENLDRKAMKVALALVNLCGNMKDVRYEPTMAAMSFIRSITNDDYNVNNILRKKSKFTSTENSDDKEEGEIIEPKRKFLRSISSLICRCRELGVVRCCSLNRRTTLVNCLDLPFLPGDCGSSLLSSSLTTMGGFKSSLLFWVLCSTFCRG